MTSTPASCRAHRERCRAAGICVRCLVGDTPDGLVTCDACRADIKARKRRYAATPGRCRECGAGCGAFDRCAKCRKRTVKAISKTKAGRLARGDCVGCGRGMPEAGYRHCPICNDRRNYRGMLLRGIHSG